MFALLVDLFHMFILPIVCFVFERMLLFFWVFTTTSVCAQRQHSQVFQGDNLVADSSSSYLPCRRCLADLLIPWWVCFQNNYGLLSLEVLTTHSKHAGTYTCVASNEEGTVSCDAILEVEGKDAHRETTHSKRLGTYTC